MPIKKLNNTHLRLRAAEAAAERIYGLMDLRPPRSSSHAALVRFDRDIVYDRVGLVYGETRSLTDISFRLPKGKRLALVGPSGGGKSSIVNLLPRLYEPTEGRILIDGQDIRQWDLEALRRLVAYVTQEVFLFHDTIYENIRYGRPNASRAEIEEAAEQAHCIEYIRKLPHGFDTVVGDRGACLSGGERQRLAIARAFLKQAPVLVLDEATSNLDSSSEKIIHTALEALMEDRTVMIVAHRFSTIQSVDEILVVGGGRVHQHGTHQTLVEQPGIYRGLYEQQALSL